VDELKWRLIDVWCGLEQSILTRLLTSGKEDIERMSMLKDISSTACELTMLILSISVTVNVTCLTVTSLITLANTFFEVRWPILWYILSQLIFVCNGERIIKIGQYFRKLCSNGKGSSFLTHSI